MSVHYEVTKRVNEHGDHRKVGKVGADVLTAISALHSCVKSILVRQNIFLIRGTQYHANLLVRYFLSMTNKTDNTTKQKDHVVL